MSRETNNDFKDLIEFFKNYSLENVIKNDEYIKIASSIHKKYFSYLSIIGELSALYNNTTNTPSIHNNQIEYLKESCSDIGNSFFSLVNGAYKPANLMLRSSIETFLKGFNLDIYPDIIIEKSLYKVFDNLKAQNFYQSEPQKTLYNNIHQLYVDLCADIHTATALNMAHITSMNYFPKFDIKKAQDIQTTILKLVVSYLSLILIKYKSYYFKMHHKNQENIISSIPGNIKRLIQGIE